MMNAKFDTPNRVPYDAIIARLGLNIRYLMTFEYRYMPEKIEQIMVSGLI